MVSVLMSHFGVLACEFLVEIPRIRKDSETLSNSGFSVVSRGRRENERVRYEPVATDNANVATHRTNQAPSIIREVRKVK